MNKVLVIENELNIERELWKFLSKSFDVKLDYNELRGNIREVREKDNLTILFSAENMYNEEISNHFKTHDTLVFHTTEMQWKQFVGLTKLGLALNKAGLLTIKKVYMSYYQEDFSIDTVKKDLNEVCDPIEFNELLKIIEFYWYNPINEEKILIKDI